MNSDFIERRFDVGQDHVVCRFFRPVEEPKDISPYGDFRCDFVVIWPDAERRGHACGVDGVQALLLAMQVAHSRLIASDAYRSGRLTYLGGRDLALPAMLGDLPADNGQ